ncbi:MAG: copper chaperone [Chitinophagaceae bacterium]|nr:MAG: copper chaperone [Chitinophagaceae bacterium]
MKSIIALLGLIGGTASLSTASAQDMKTDSFKVYGNCEMCKSRIEKAAHAEGISTAKWNVDTKMITVSYDPGKTTSEAIKKRIALVGHDTDEHKAKDSTYHKLPGCCLYDRKKGEASPHKH